jgi:signal transduction histidine kinase/CheY-like chemotaxis protein
VGAIRSIFAGDLRQFEALVNAEDAWWRVTIIATADASKEQEEVAVAVLDVTDTALAQRAIESARNTVALGRISANVAHEMNNILQLVLALLEDVRQAEDVSTLGQFASDVERTVQRGVSLTRQLLSFSSPERGSVVAFDLAAALTEWWPLLRQSVGASRHARLSAGTELRVVASRREVELALFNIMGNSRDASAPGSWITVALEEAGDFARLDVVDQGSGMSPEVLRRATEPFFTTKGAQSGTGLGLATVRQVVEQVGGKLAIASTAGQGTTVSMYLPRERGVGGFPSVRPASALREGRRVLYLEDDALLGDVLKHQLSVRGMTVRRYSSVSVALAALRDEPSWATAVLADIALDDGTGLDVAEAVATARPDVRVVIYSGQVDPHERARIEQRGWTLLEKPVNVTAICEALQNG